MIYLGQHIIRQTNLELTDAIKYFYSYDLEDKDYHDIVKSPCGSYPTQPWEVAVCPSTGDNYYDFSNDIDPLVLDSIWKGFSDFLEDTEIYLASINSLKIDPSNDNIVYVGTDEGVFISTDSGKTWGQINDGFLNMRIIYSLTFDPENGDLYAMTPYGIFKLEEK